MLFHSVLLCRVDVNIDITVHYKSLPKVVFSLVLYLKNPNAHHFLNKFPKPFQLISHPICFLKF